jgi:hypothetical protein
MTCKITKDGSVTIIACSNISAHQTWPKLRRDGSKNLTYKQAQKLKEKP